MVKEMTEIVRTSTNWIKSWIPPFGSGAKEVERVVVREVTQVMAAPTGSVFIRVAGISGVLAVCLGAYGAHAMKLNPQKEYLKVAFDTGSRYHFFHTLALLGVPLTKRPNLVGTLLCLGMLLFSGSCYSYALTENETVRKVAPYGGMLLIAAWASMIF